MLNHSAIEPVVFADIPEFPGYRVGSDGSVWSCRSRRPTPEKNGSVAFLSSTWKKLKPKKNIDGYRCFVLYKDGVRRNVRGAVVVLTSFVCPRPNGMEACHCNCVRDDDRLGNLRWDTPKNNHADKVLHGTNQVGDRSSNHVLTSDQVLEIRTRKANGERSSVLAREFGVRRGTINEINRRKSWKHI